MERPEEKEKSVLFIQEATTSCHSLSFDMSQTEW